MTKRQSVLKNIKKHKGIYFTNLIVILLLIGTIRFISYDKQVVKQELIEEVKKEALEDKQVTTLASSSVDQNKYVTAAEVQIILLSIYPVGSLYISTNNTNPSQYIGGNWERYGNGKTIVGVNESETEFASVNKTGGSKTNQIRTDNLPARMGYATQVGTLTSGSSWGAASSGWLMSCLYDLGWKSDQPLNNLQPYITTYIWKRTS